MGWGELETYEGRYLNIYFEEKGVFVVRLLEGSHAAKSVDKCVCDDDTCLFASSYVNKRPDHRHILHDIQFLTTCRTMRP